MGMPEERAPKGPPWPQAAMGCWREGGSSPPPKKFPQKMFIQNNFPEGATAAAGRQGVLEGGEGGGVPLHKKCSLNNLVNIFVHKKISPKGPLRQQAVRRCSMEGGKGYREFQGIQV